MCRVHNNFQGFAMSPYFSCCLQTVKNVHWKQKPNILNRRVCIHLRMKDTNEQKSAEMKFLIRGVTMDVCIIDGPVPKPDSDNRTRLLRICFQGILIRHYNYYVCVCISLYFHRFNWSNITIVCLLRSYLFCNIFYLLPVGI